MKRPLILALGLLAVRPAGAQELRYEHDSVFVKLREGTSLPSLPLILGSESLFERVLRLRTTDALALENELRGHPEVEWAEKSFYAGTRELPIASPARASSKDRRSPYAGFSDPYMSRLWAFRDASENGAGVAQAYARHGRPSGNPVVVAVIDTGVDYNHEDLRARMWVNRREIPGNGVDDDRNGYVDDVHGINTLVRNRAGVATGDPMASNFHGTHVAGTIAAEHNNGQGIAGTASHALIMAIRTIPDRGDETDRDVVESLLYAARNGAKVINCSFGKRNSPDRGRLLAETISHVGRAHGALVVAASGNDSRDGNKYSIDSHRDFPAGLDNDNLLVVAATRASGGLADFSNVGRVNVDVAAPGEGIHSTMPGDGYGSSSGTSMATPLVSGMAAQIMAFHPRLSPLQVKSAIMDSVSPVPAFARHMVTGGRVDMDAALENAGRR